MKSSLFTALRVVWGISIVSANIVYVASYFSTRLFYFMDHIVLKKGKQKTCPYFITDLLL